MTVTAPPRAAAAIAAGVLAVLDGVWFLLGTFWWSLVTGLGQSDLLVPGQIADAVIGLLLVLGGVSLLARVAAGRVLCLFAAGLALVATVVDAVLRSRLVLFLVGGPTGLGDPLVRGIVISAPLVVLLVLAALPDTRRWTHR
ncbi:MULTISPECIES: hypothetical protein [unclassified Amycolatopsis]|uniref:hypothetical protein n=1 Tax=unclassified Amycolatopsis TaxID=2618356 RepID=UPI0028749C6E|nr:MULTISPECIES: hypothetical protein [unclassified Amycolatopsis]MDS0137475.1 hypothetical protein [Amycolatopsis sp. 505]MDS0141670.1 hypothetical protein [Amycolatopsis sp. CM201R]